MEVNPITILILVSICAFLSGFFFGWNVLLFEGKELVRNYCTENVQSCGEMCYVIENEQVFVDQNILLTSNQYEYKS